MPWRADKEHVRLGNFHSRWQSRRRRLPTAAGPRSHLRISPPCRSIDRLDRLRLDARWDALVTGSRCLCGFLGEGGIGRRAYASFASASLGRCYRNRLPRVLFCGARDTPCGEGPERA
ncbi:hypothetical protein SKAU_G00290510 [Synaphobranchus kaupii]|uniref:Uncharacterized protein n=1 Tax=Synaphobranchus kaupii TaxID=118154 RepID=A0A9Q1ETQ9_SYNKA|nr:hypothetical protein SKAU_G00290510 [Synaphobranchus kaupii]